MPFLPPNQQRQSTEGSVSIEKKTTTRYNHSFSPHVQSTLRVLNERNGEVQQRQFTYQEEAAGGDTDVTSARDSATELDA